jgi:hypothetical protein
MSVAGHREQVDLVSSENCGQSQRSSNLDMYEQNSGLISPAAAALLTSRHVYPMPSATRMMVSLKEKESYSVI